MSDAESSERSPVVFLYKNGVIPQPCQSDLGRQEVGQQWRTFDMGLFTHSYPLQSIHMKKRGECERYTVKVCSL